MDANDNIIPILPEDMGEGFKDPIDDHELLKKIIKQSGVEVKKKFQYENFNAVKQVVPNLRNKK